MRNSEILFWTLIIVYWILVFLKMLGELITGKALELFEIGEIICIVGLVSSAMWNQYEGVK